MMQKKNGIGWSKTNADEIRVGWSKMVLTCDVNIPNREDRIKTAETKIGSISDFEMPKWGKGKMLDLYMLDVNTVDIYKEAEKALKIALTELNRKYQKDKKDKLEESDVKAITITNPKNIYLVIPQKMNPALNVTSYTSCFNNCFHFYITLDFANLPSDMMGWLLATKETLNSQKFKLDQADAIIAGRLGNNWAGFRIVKD